MQRKKALHKAGMIAVLLVFAFAIALLSGCAPQEGKNGFGSGSQDLTGLELNTSASSGESSSLSEEKKAQLLSDKEKGLLILVNKENHIDSDYVPEDLTSIKYYAEDRNKYSRYMREEAAQQFHAMVEDAAEQGINIVMTTAYRSYDLQEILWNYNVSQKGEEEANKTSAKPGESEHQTGLAVDISTSEIDYRNSSDFANTAAGRWTKQNAWKYGFILRFPEGKSDITGYSYEAWHFRYVGKTAAEDIYKDDLTLEEYLEKYGL